MKLLFITDLYPIDNDDEPLTLSAFVNNWKQLGHYIDVIRPNFILNTLIRRKTIYKTGKFTRNGINIYNLNLITPFWFNVKNKLPSGFNLTDYDAIIAHMPSGILFAEALTEGLTIPKVYSAHASDIEVLSNYLYSFYFKSKLKTAYNNADVISARSPILKAQISKLISKNEEEIRVAYSGVEAKKIVSLDIFEDKIKYIKSTNTLKIITVASNIERKNIKTVIRALASLKEINWHYTLICKGKNFDNIENIINKLDLKEKVTLLKNISNSEVIEKMKATQLFILLSEKETFGMVYLEAMSQGNAIILKKGEAIDGIIIDEKNGYTCQNLPDQLEKTIKKIKNTELKELLELARNSYETISDYTDKNAAINYISIIEEAINKAKLRYEKLQ